MKIYLLPTPSKLQPSSQSFEYPSGNPDYGVEQDFLDYLIQKQFIVNSPDKADWHYLPVFWTRWHLNHDYGKKGREELQSEVAKLLIDPDKTFTICQYDDGPLANLGSTILFLASRKGKKGIDIPLLRNRHKIPLLKPRKKYLASFAGRLNNHPIRQQMAKAVKDRTDIFIRDGDSGQKFFLDQTLQSWCALCPRGYGGSSFRFYEAMQLGVVPFLIGDIDTRPFKKFINWQSASIFTDKADTISSQLATISKKQLWEMGRRARAIYLKDLQYEKWGAYVLKELELLR